MNTIAQLDKLVVRYALLPVVSMAQDYLVEIVEPVSWVPQKMSMSLTEIWNDRLKGHELIVKTLVLNAWKKAISASNPCGYHSEAQDYIDKMLAIIEVELIECDLLSPKAKKE